MRSNLSPAASPATFSSRVSRALRALVMATVLMTALTVPARVQAAQPATAPDVTPFAQLQQMLPTPNSYRNAAGAPGHAYWQQRADYRIRARLDENNRRLTATETIVYTNRSPDSLPYLWLQLDQNRFKRDSLEQRSRTGARTEDGQSDQLSFGALRRHQAQQDRAYGFDIQRVEDDDGRALPHTVVETMLRIDLPVALKPGTSQTLVIDWAYNIIEEAAMNGRAGYEHFPDTDTYIYSLAQWFPRMVAYTDYAAWQHHQFLGRGEFTLEFGDYDVELTVPADHIVAATGELVNAREALRPEQLERMQRARQANSPMFIVTPEEARQNESERLSGERTWRFQASNVRDFAWASSRKFIWDAMNHPQPGAEPESVLAMSFYPNEAEPLWSQYSTQAVVHTMEVYSRFSFPYPYPTAQSVNVWERGGMEYPMITFNGYRPKPLKEPKGDTAATYSRSIKHRLIGVIIHEIGHIYFPMTVNTDERQWTWMDEGINSFLEYVASLEWEENFFAYEDELSLLDQIASYMISENQVPIMTQSDSVLQFGPNAYTKPAAALLVLRETVLGRERFDFAFSEYARRWRFKRPTPADFFRTMEDASGIDLDWFWRGWFYSTDHVDVHLADVREYQLASGDPEIDLAADKVLDRLNTPEPLEQRRNRDAGLVPRVDRVPGLRDFYNENDRYTPSNEDRNTYREYLNELEPWERAVLERGLKDNEYIYFIDFVNEGGLLTPLPLELTFSDGSVERLDVPAEIWRRNPRAVTKLLIRPLALTSIAVDPDHATGDTDRSDNHYPRRRQPSRLQLYKWPDDTRDLMKGMLQALEAEEEAKGAAAPLSAPR